MVALERFEFRWVCTWVQWSADEKETIEMLAINIVEMNFFKGGSDNGGTSRRAVDMAVMVVVVVGAAVVLTVRGCACHIWCLGGGVQNNTAPQK